MTEAEARILLQEYLDEEGERDSEFRWRAGDCVIEDAMAFTFQLEAYVGNTRVAVTRAGELWDGYNLLGDYSSEAYPDAITPLASTFKSGGVEICPM